MQDAMMIRANDNDIVIIVIDRLYKAMNMMCFANSGSVRFANLGVANLTFVVIKLF